MKRFLLVCSAAAMIVSVFTGCSNGRVDDTAPPAATLSPSPIVSPSDDITDDVKRGIDDMGDAVRDGAEDVKDGIEDMVESPRGTM